MIKERDINYEIDMMNKPTRFLQEEKIRKKRCKRRLCVCLHMVYKNKISNTKVGNCYAGMMTEAKQSAD